MRIRLYQLSFLIKYNTRSVLPLSRILGLTRYLDT